MPAKGDTFFTPDHAPPDVQHKFYSDEEIVF